jgi:hypothetical protein
VKARFEPFGTVLMGDRPAAFANVFHNDLQQWAKVLKAAGMMPEN